MSSSDWSISSDERQTHERTFSQLQSENGRINGATARAVFVKSKLSTEELAQIWYISLFLSFFLSFSACWRCGCSCGWRGRERSADWRRRGPGWCREREREAKRKAEGGGIVVVVLECHVCVDLFISLALSFCPSVVLHAVLLYYARRLADVDKDGHMTVNEFVIAMHLIMQRVSVPAFLSCLFDFSLPVVLSTNRLKAMNYQRNYPWNYNPLMLSFLLYLPKYSLLLLCLFLFSFSFSSFSSLLFVLSILGHLLCWILFDFMLCYYVMLLAILTPH